MKFLLLFPLISLLVSLNFFNNHCQFSSFFKETSCISGEESKSLGIYFQRIDQRQPLEKESSKAAQDFIRETRIFIERVARKVQINIRNLPSLRPVIKAIEEPFYIVKRKMREVLTPESDKIKLSSL